MTSLSMTSSHLATKRAFLPYKMSEGEGKGIYARDIYYSVE